MNYSEEIADLIIGEMCEGKPLATLCREHGLQRRTIYKWREKRPEFAQRYNAAQQVLADHLFEEMLSIADNITLDPNSKDNRVLVDKAKLQIETRKYLCGRLNPLRYHEQQGIALNVNLNKKLDEMSDQELIELRNRYLALPAPPKLIEAPRK
jgi:hypothetical protein